MPMNEPSCPRFRDTRVASFDIGGTHLRGAVVELRSGQARILEQQRRASPSHRVRPELSAPQRLQLVIDFIAEFTQQASTRYGVAELVAAFPGPVQGRGTVSNLATLCGPDAKLGAPMPLHELLQIRLPGHSVLVLNDVSAAGFRFAAEAQDFALLTLGSGIGLKVFIKGQPITGPNGRGGELTHMVFDRSPQAPICDCGGRGHLGALASGRAWQRACAELKTAGSEPDLHEFCEPLARAVAMLHYSLGLEHFVFAGGLSEGLGDRLRAAIVARLAEQGWDTGQDWNGMVRLAPADDSHALIGGAFALAGR